MGLIWEISAHAARQNAWNFGARLFCKNIKTSGFNDIYNIQFFQDTYSQKGFFPYAFQSPSPAARPPARPPVMDHRLSNWFVFQYFSVQNWVKLVRVPVFLSSKLSQNGSCSSISQFKTDQNDSFSNMFLIPIDFLPASWWVHARCRGQLFYMRVLG